MNATRALLWKEWRGLAGIRWAGMALGAVLPLAFALGAERVTRDGGLLAGHASWTPRVILMEVLPASLALAIWPLVALLAAAQAFAADRASGTESFLLERPVSRARIFLARLAMTYGSLAAVVVGTALLTFAIAWVVADPDAESSRRAFGILAAGAAGAAVVVLCGAGASGLVKSPMVAVLLGMVLVGAPFLLSTELASRFPAARIGLVPVGALWPWLLIPTYFLAGWVRATRGEPLGRGAAKRMAVVLAAGVAVVGAGFVLSAVWAIRHEATTGAWSLDVAMPRSGPSIAVRAAGRSGIDAGWIVDAADGRRLRFLPPSHAYASGWKADGSVLAVATDAGRLGALDDRVRVAFYRADGAPARPPVVLPEATSVEALAWSGSRVAMTVFTDRPTAEVWFLDPESGSVERSGFRRPFLHLFGPTDDGSLWIRVFRRSGDSKVVPANTEPRSIELYRIDPLARAVSPAPVVLEERWISWWFQGRLSRSGRYWVQENVDAAGVSSRSIVDLSTGAVAAEPHPTRNLFWLAEDRIAWTETAGETSVLRIAGVGEPGRVIGAWKRAHLDPLPAPGGEAILVRISRRKPSGPGSTSGGLGEDAVAAIPPVEAFGETPSARAYLPAEDRWIEAGHLDARRGGFRPMLSWAGPKTFLRSWPGTAELVRIDRPEEVVRLW